MRVHIETLFLARARAGASCTTSEAAVAVRHPSRSAVSGALALSVVALVLCVVLPRSSAAQDVPIVGDGPLSPAVRLEIEARCSEQLHNHPEAKLQWTLDPAAVGDAPGAEDFLRSSEFRVDISKYPFGFDLGRYRSINVSRQPGVDSRAAVSTLTHKLEPGVYYTVRVLVRTKDAWIASASRGFLSSVCPADGIDAHEGGRP